jgi:hypothetical protein
LFLASEVTTAAKHEQSIEGEKELGQRLFVRIMTSSSIAKVQKPRGPFPRSYFSFPNARYCAERRPVRTRTSEAVQGASSRFDVSMRSLILADAKKAVGKRATSEKLKDLAMSSEFDVTKVSLQCDLRTPKPKAISGGFSLPNRFLFAVFGLGVARECVPQ